MRFDTPRSIARVAALALVVSVAACGKKDQTADSGATATESNGAVSTATPTGFSVTDVSLGRTLGSNKTVSDKTTTFKPSDTIYASVATAGAPNNTTLNARWLYQDGQVVNEEVKTIGANDGAATEFHISKPSGFPKGSYKVEILVNGTAASTKEFTVQ